MVRRLLLLLPLVFLGADCRDPLLALEARLYDARGREVLFHGINARVAGLFDVTFDDGRIPLEPIPPFGRGDCRFMAQELGMNLLRLPVNWSGIEPERGVYDETYIDQIVKLVFQCGLEDVHVLVDLHQDAWSKEIGEDGAPLWAIIPPPEMLLEGPLTEGELELRRFSPAALNAAQSFFENQEDLQGAYADMLVHLAERLRGQPTLVGIEIMNEPFLLPGQTPDGDIWKPVEAMNVVMAEAIRQATPEISVFFEPNTVRNTLDNATIHAPFPVSDAVYAPHVYTGVFSLFPGTIENMRTSVTNAVAEAAQAGTPLLIGEWGNDPKTVEGREYIANMLQVFDESRVSWAFWVYEEWSQGSWGLYDENPGPSRGALRDPIADILARPFPRAVSGKIDSVEYDPASRELRVLISERIGNVHVFSIPRRTYPDGIRVRCDGNAVGAVPSRGRARIRCPGSEIRIQPR